MSTPGVPRVARVAYRSIAEVLEEAKKRTTIGTTISGSTTPLQILQRCLSTRSVSSTDLCSAEQLQEAPATQQDAQLRVIGVGTFGVVFEVPGTTLAFKRTIHGPCQASVLTGEFLFGLEVRKAFLDHAAVILQREPNLQHLLLPRVPYYLDCWSSIKADSKHEWWIQNGHKFPEVSGSHRPGPCFSFERIMPLPLAIREALIKQYFRKDLVEQALKNPDNKDAMIRPYLGHSFVHLDEKQRTYGRDTLRNFPLYLDELEQLDMNPVQIAKEMALAIATAHWVASIDLMDSEFVIASRPPVLPDQPSKDPQISSNRSFHELRASRSGQTDILQPEKDHQPVINSHHNHATQLWLLDFDKVKIFDYAEETSAADIQTLVSRTRANDPYYPSSLPTSKLEAEAWRAFGSTYVTASRALQKETYEIHRRVARFMPKMSDASAEEYFNMPVKILEEWRAQEEQSLGAEETKRRNRLARDHQGWGVLRK